jgi:hypothetical protein
MKSILFLCLLSGTVAQLADGQSPRAVRARKAEIAVRVRSVPVIASITFLKIADGAAIELTGVNNAVLTLGSLSNTAQANHNGTQIWSQEASFAVSTRLGLRLDLSEPSRRGTARVSAYLMNTDLLRKVWLDGIPLSIIPNVISSHISYGTVTEHVLKIVVPASAPPGPLTDLIGVIVTPN